MKYRKKKEQRVAMSSKVVFETPNDRLVNIKVIGIGGAGNNAVNRMIDFGVRRVDFWAMNTDKQAIASSKSTLKLQLGEKLTGGLGAGANPEVGEKAALESKQDIVKALEGSDMVFITCGMGGGTGTGGAPVIAECAKAVGALTVGVVTRPTKFEGTAKARKADEGIARLREHVDALIIVPNDKIQKLAGARTLHQAFMMADDVLRQAVQGISDIIHTHGLINVDFADVRKVLENCGTALMGIGVASGENRAEEAVERAIKSPLLESSIAGARHVLLNVAGNDEITYDEFAKIQELVHEIVAHEGVEVILGATTEQELGDEIRVTIIATGFGETIKATAKIPSIQMPQTIGDAVPQISPIRFNPNIGELNIPVFMQKEDKK